MLIAWGNVFGIAGVSSLVTLLLLQVYRWQHRELSFPHSVGLALVCGAGFIGWFTIFNLFSLSGLNNDIPVPLFPISPEDMGCGITVLLSTLLYGFLSQKNRANQNIWRQFGLIGWLLPALVALVIDVYFI